MVLEKILESPLDCKDALHLPDGIEPFCLIPFGYPAVPASVKDKWDPSIVHQDTW